MARPTRAASLIAALAAAATLGLPVAARAQRAGRVPRLQLELGAAVASTPYVEDDNGARVAGGIAPELGVVARWDAGRRATVGVGLRASRVPVHVQESGRRLDAGPATHADLLGLAAFALGARVELRAAAGLSHVSGDGTIVPFRAGNDAPWHPTGEIGVDVGLGARWPLALAVTASATRFGSATVSDPVKQAGAVTRLLVGVRYGR